ncbi:hypothetical protein SISSUDRAFT_1064947 [Sistotremastrum suecicum HHB10207 ss-3]|uniref:Uncharacterized protein n=1 Tax=Sistotremastrum suecicum HHB10207 ss-3 TaxID=1314776 RepID=A0A166A198_9AGAM|nr:hypothetical protein SISSUDRAFT_1064947 [Sistotremastrum suecicum HHB10207 ss-3]
MQDGRALKYELDCFNHGDIDSSSISRTTRSVIKCSPPTNEYPEALQELCAVTEVESEKSSRAGIEGSEEPPKSVNIMRTGKPPNVKSTGSNPYPSESLGVDFHSFPLWMSYNEEELKIRSIQHTRHLNARIFTLLRRVDHIEHEYEERGRFNQEVEGFRSKDSARPPSLTLRNEQSQYDETMLCAECWQNRYAFSPSFGLDYLDAADIDTVRRISFHEVTQYRRFGADIPFSNQVNYIFVDQAARSMEIKRVVQGTDGVLYSDANLGVHVDRGFHVIIRYAAILLYTRSIVSSTLLDSNSICLL